MSESRSIQPAWCRELPIQQQSVLLLAARGPDGVPKTHPCKRVQRAYRGSVLTAAFLGREMHFDDEGDSFMRLSEMHNLDTWREVMADFFESVDQLPHHFFLHLLHGAEILGYKHPDSWMRDRWGMFYRWGCSSLHMTPETEFEMDLRLNDGDRERWE